jgi:hypothetical protein
MVDAVPNLPTGVSPSMPAIKIARPDIILQNDSEMPIEMMTDLIFEDIGGQEIINISRNDLINGQNVVYQPIKNLSYISYQYNAKNLLALGATSDSHFLNFSIDLQNKMPNSVKPVQLDANNNLIISLANIAKDEQVEIEFITSGSILDDTIY